MELFYVRELLHYCNIFPGKCSAMPRRAIDFYDFTFVLRGSMVCTADDETYVLRRNDAIFLKPGTVRSRAVGTEPVEYVSFNFRMAADRELPFSPYMPNCISGNIRRLISAFPHSHLSASDHSKEKTASMLNFILFELLDTVEQPLGSEHISRIIRYVDSHLTQRLSLRDVSREIGLTREYISHIFKKEMKKTLTDYINERKMLLAKEMIISERMSLTDLSSYLGYENYGYFSRLFKRYFGIPPVKFKGEI